MKIIVAPDSFKGSLSSIEAAASIERGIRRVLPDADIAVIPLADGGEGTLEALVRSTGGSTLPVWVTGPLGDPVEARYGILGDGQTAVVEMASASGLTLVPEGKRDPTKTTTFGTGQLIKTALERGVRKIILGIGGSATTDGGAGMAQALGVRFLRRDGSPIAEPLSGGRLSGVERIDASELHPALRDAAMNVACDVQNPLLGPTGAVMVYSRQKGATDQQLDLLEKNMSFFADAVEKACGKSLRNIPGTGAAGGMAVPLLAFTSAKLQSGIRLVLDACRFAERIRGADLILTGEGKTDFQTVFGKTIRGVADEAKAQGIPLVVLSGCVEPEADNLYNYGVTSMFSICPGPLSLEKAVEQAGVLLEDAAARVLRVF